MRLIDADALEERIEYRFNKTVAPQLLVDTLGWALRRVRNAPTVDPVMHGHWMYGNFFYPPMCSVCKKCVRTPGYIGDEQFYKANYSHCPNCGAIMDEEVTGNV